MIYQEITSHLTAQGVGTFGTNMFWGFSPPDPDTAVIVYEYGGGSPTYTKQGMEWDFVSFQVTARAKTYVLAMQKAEQVYAALKHVRGIELGDSLYDSIRANQRPFDPGPQDDRGRTLIICNYTAKRRAA